MLSNDSSWRVFCVVGLLACMIYLAAVCKCSSLLSSYRKMESHCSVLWFESVLWECNIYYLGILFLCKLVLQMSLYKHASSTVLCCGMYVYQKIFFAFHKSLSQYQIRIKCVSVFLFLSYVNMPIPIVLVVVRRVVNKQTMGMLL